MSIPNSIQGLWHCCKCSLSLGSLCLQAVGLICSHICKICSCFLHLGRESRPLNQHLKNLGLIPAEPEQRMALQAGSKAFLPVEKSFHKLLGIGCAEEQRAGQDFSLVACGTAMWHCLISPDQALDTGPCFRNLLKMHHHHLFGAYLAKEESPLCPLHTTRQDFTISRSSAIQIHLYNIA